MTQHPFFAAEPIRRYFLWAGADPVEAEALATGVETGSRPWMPVNAATGERHTAETFIKAMDDFRNALPDNGSAFDWSTAGLDPYKTTDTITDIALPAAGAEKVDSVFIGLTGGRAVGKSYLTSCLEEIGFHRVHPFNPGKALLRGYYVSRGATEDEAFSMTDGALKDQPAPRDVLPVDPDTGKNYTSRFLMERLGSFMAKRIGLDCTIGAELRHWSSVGKERILIDSVVYEADHIRQMPNSAILGIEVPADKKKDSGILADITDSHVSQIKVDAYVLNEMNGAESLMSNFHAAVRGLGIQLDEPEEMPEP